MIKLTIGTIYLAAIFFGAAPYTANASASKPACRACAEKIAVADMHAFVENASSAIASLLAGCQSIRLTPEKICQVDIFESPALAGALKLLPSLAGFIDADSKRNAVASIDKEPAYCVQLEKMLINMKPIATEVEQNQTILMVEMLFSHGENAKLPGKKRFAVAKSRINMEKMQSAITQQLFECSIRIASPYEDLDAGVIADGRSQYHNRRLTPPRDRRHREESGQLQASAKDATNKRNAKDETQTNVHNAGDSHKEIMDGVEDSFWTGTWSIPANDMQSKEREGLIQHSELAPIHSFDGQRPYEWNKQKVAVDIVDEKAKDGKKRSDGGYMRESNALLSRYEDRNPSSYQENEDFTFELPPPDYTGVDPDKIITGDRFGPGNPDESYSDEIIEGMPILPNMK